MEGATARSSGFFKPIYRRLYVPHAVKLGFLGYVPQLGDQHLAER